MNAFRAILWKDLVTEWRSRDRLVGMAVFALLVVVTFYFAAPAGSTPEARSHLPGLLWVAYVFAALLGLGRAFASELENEALSGLALAPGDRGWIYLGKATASLVFLLIVQALTAFAFGVVFAVPLFAVALPFALVAVLGAIGLAAIGTLFSAMAVRTSYREVMLPLLMLPLLVPVVLGSVRATAGLLAGDALAGDALRLLVATDGVYLIVSFLCFEYVLDE